MKRYRAWSAWFVLSPLLLSGFPAASAPPAGPQPATARGTPIPTRPPAAFPPLPLQGPLTLDSGKKPGIVPPKVDYNALQGSVDILRHAVDSYAKDLGNVSKYAKYCRSKQYSVEEQLKAGCKGTDTLDQCKEKLFLHCMNTAGYAEFQAKRYKEAAQKFLDVMPKMIESLKAAQARVKYEAFYYDFD